MKQIRESVEIWNQKNKNNSKKKKKKKKKKQVLSHDGPD